MKTSIRIVVFLVCLALMSPAYSSQEYEKIADQEKISLGQKVKDIFRGGLEAIKEFMDSTSDKDPAPKFIIEMHDGRVLRANEYWDEGQEVVLKVYDSKVYIKKAEIKEIRPR